VSDWTLFRHGEATVSVGQPFYGRPKIVGNAPLSANGFDALIAALAEAKRAYQEGEA
jgi:broad specificity phosphatase PhoE